jgi:hypothetical protein
MESPPDPSRLRAPHFYPDLAVTYRPFERTFANIVVKRGSGLAQEQRQFAPMLEHVAQGLAETGVGLDLALLKLFVHPLVQPLHGRSASRLMVREALLGRELLGAAVRVLGVDSGQHLDHVAAFLGEMLEHIDKLAATVREAIA